MAKEYEYDVAISFLASDENLALQIKRAVEKRISCFVFTEEQKRLSGSDGEVMLNQIFSKDARIVVILHRDLWAKTNWTRVEETAIRNRGFDEGYDFVIFVPLDNPVHPPEWLPKNRIWTKLDPWGIEGLASVIERKIQEHGGEVREETVLDKALSAKQEIDGHIKRENILVNFEGLKLAQTEYNKVKESIKQQCDDIKKSIPDWHFYFKDNTQEGFDVISYGHTLTIQWYPYASNTPEGSYLMIGLFRGTFGDVFSNPQQVILDRLRFDINEFDQKGWSDKQSRKDFKSSAELVDRYFSELIKRIAAKRKEEKY